MPHFSGNFSNNKMIYRDHRRRFGTSTSGSTSTAMDSNYNANGDGSSSIEDNNNNDGMEEAVPKLNPTVAMLLRGEHLPTVKAAVPTTEKKMVSLIQIFTFEAYKLDQTFKRTTSKRLTFLFMTNQQKRGKSIQFGGEQRSL
jgi:hypothetical protein